MSTKGNTKEVDGITKYAIMKETTKEVRMKKRALFEGWFDFAGRRSRWNYIGVIVFQLIAILALATVLFVFVGINPFVTIWGLMTVGLAVIWMTVSITTQRLRDCGMTTAWKLAVTNIIAYLTGIPYLFIMFWPPRR